MGIMWFAMAVDLVLYALVGAVIVRLGRRALPAPWNQPSVMIPFVLALGALLTLATFPHWLVYPK